MATSLEVPLTTGVVAGGIVTLAVRFWRRWGNGSSLTKVSLKLRIGEENIEEKRDDKNQEK